MIRVAAVGDVHVSTRSAGTLRPAFADLAEHADLLLIAGDLTRSGQPEEGAVFAREVAGLPVPVIAVLGNHDHHRDAAADIVGQLTQAGVTVLDGTAVELTVHGEDVAVAGVKGFGGGFPDHPIEAFGEREVREFMAHSTRSADALRTALSEARAELRIALTHYAPVPDTLAGEPRELYPFLGSRLLGEAIDLGGATFAIHGHAHFGAEFGATPGGVPVRNVAQPVIKDRYRIYHVRAA